MDRQEEQDIIARVRRGERAAFAALVDAYAKPIFNLAFRMTGSHQDAEDLAQETFIRAYQNLRSFDPRRPFFTWLYTIGLNLIRNHLKKSKKTDVADRWEGTGAETGHPDPAANPEEILIDGQKAHLLEQSLLKLPEAFREAVVLRYIGRLSFEEIARLSGISLSLAKMRVYRGLERLKAIVESEEE